MRRPIKQWWFAAFAFAFSGMAEEGPSASRYSREIRPLLERYCSDCHGDGMDKGNVSLDAFESEAARAS